MNIPHKIHIVLYISNFHDFLWVVFPKTLNILFKSQFKNIFWKYSRKFKYVQLSFSKWKLFSAQNFFAHFGKSFLLPVYLIHYTVHGISGLFDM